MPAHTKQIASPLAMTTILKYPNGHGNASNGHGNDPNGHGNDSNGHGNDPNRHGN